MPRARRRPGLDREALVAAALALRDREGHEATSFRRLARAFGVTPVALYNYVENKDQLLAAMLDAGWAEVAVPEPSLRARDDWWDGFAQLARAIRETFLAHPAGAAIAASRPAAGPPVLAIIEVILGLLERAG